MRTTAMSLLLFQEKKEELDEDFLDSDLQQIACESRQEMLQTAYNCYKNASECEDEESEEWLTQYMMGKSVEKMMREPLEYLEHYRLVGMAHTVHDGEKCVEKMEREPLEYLEHYRLVGMADTVHDGKKC